MLKVLLLLRLRVSSLFAIDFKPLVNDDHHEFLEFALIELALGQVSNLNTAAGDEQIGALSERLLLLIDQVLPRLDGFFARLRFLVGPVLDVQQTLPFQCEVALVLLLLIVDCLHGGIAVLVLAHCLHDDESASVKFQLRLDHTGHSLSRGSSLLVALFRLYSLLFTFLVKLLFDLARKLDELIGSMWILELNKPSTLV